jgi:hypothetical protein
MRYKEGWETEFEKKAGRRAKRKRRKMKVSGRGALRIKDLMAKKSPD